MLIDAPIRGTDVYGSGAYQAPRGGRRHKGIDIACYKGSTVLSAADGTVTKIGYPYDPSDPKKGHLRYVQVTDGQGYDARYFYVSASVEVGDLIKRGDKLGTTQGLAEIYPGITDHFHFEVLSDGNPVSPMEYPKHEGQEHAHG